MTTTSDQWSTKLCPQCDGPARADYGRTTFTNTLGTFCSYKCLSEYEAMLFRTCPTCDGAGRIEREVP
jgi:hypothetical protein